MKSVNKLFTGKTLMVLSSVLLVAVVIAAGSQAASARVWINDSNIYIGNKGHDLLGTNNKNFRVCNYGATENHRYESPRWPSWSPTYPVDQRFRSTSSAWISPENDSASGQQITINAGEDAADLRMNFIGHYCTANMFDAAGNDIENYQDNYDWNAVNLDRQMVRETRLNTTTNAVAEGHPTAPPSCNDDPQGLAVSDSIKDAPMSLDWDPAWGNNPPSNRPFYVKPGGGDGQPLYQNFSVSGFSDLSPGCYTIRISVETQSTTRRASDGGWMCSKDGASAGPSGTGCDPLTYRFRVTVNIESSQRIQGIKRAANDSANAGVTGNQVRIDGGTNGSSTSNPFSFDVPAGERWVAVEGEPDHSVEYIYCIDATVEPDRSLCSDGSSSTRGDGSLFRVDVPEGSYVDVRFDFYGEEPNEDEEIVSPELKIYGANYIDILGSNFRDNKSFDIEVNTYLWPNAGLKSRPQDRTRRMWLAGIWGEDGFGGGDNANNDDSWRADPNIMTSFNSRAESGCPNTDSNCRRRVPMAYVPADDGSDSAPTSDNADSTTTPNGNDWHNIREENFGTNSNAIRTSCVAHNELYNSMCGGMASNRNDTVGRESGNYIRNVEISNIRLRVSGLGASLEEPSIQGPVDDELLQPEDQSHNLPAGSHGPDPALFSGTWDNIRPPEQGDPGRRLQSEILPINQLLFGSFGTANGLPNFTDDPEGIGTLYIGRSQQYAEVDAVTLLQDGKGEDGEPYTETSEPLSYTGRLDSVDNVDLVWDEYIDWSQVDDKGHWYTEKDRFRPTGIDEGHDRTDTTTIYDVESGSRDCKCVETDEDGNCINKECTSCTGNYPTRIDYQENNLTYYSHNTESRFGWHNTATLMVPIPDGKNGETSDSGFLPYPLSDTTPAWAGEASDYFWQDRNITSMDTSNTGILQDRSEYWIYDTSDPIYTDRRIFNTPNTPEFLTGWRLASNECTYPNGSATAKSVETKTYYPDATHLYESTPDSYSPNGQVYGGWGDDVTFDGRSDGAVDVSWEWSSNIRRVRYENSYDGRYRQLGLRDRERSNINQRLFGVEPDGAIQAGRDMATIFNPTFEVASGDVFAGGNLHSFFDSSEASSAFLFSNDQILNIDGGSGSYEDYRINPEQDRVDAYYPQDGTNATEYVFRNYQQLKDKAQPIGHTQGGTVNFTTGTGDDEDVRIIDGDAYFDGLNFAGGAGTIIIKGNLTINGNVGYAATSTGVRTQVPSAGIIVEGSILIDNSVDSVVGNYFSNGAINTGSVLVNTNMEASGAMTNTPNNNTIESDSPLQVDGLMIANNFMLMRQPSGNTLASGNPAENFDYDGRVVINPPPGFSQVFTADAIWNDVVPRN